MYTYICIVRHPTQIVKSFSKWLSVRFRSDSEEFPSAIFREFHRWSTSRRSGKRRRSSISLWRPSTKAMSVYVTHIFSNMPAERVDKFNLQFSERRPARMEKMKLNRWIKTPPPTKKSTLNVSRVLTNSHDCIFQLFAIIHLYNITEIVAKNWN